jgi:dihydroxy-acid dehydratase
MIAIDADTGTITLEVSDDELANRRVAWKAPKLQYERGVLAKYAQLVGPARYGAVTS